MTKMNADLAQLAYKWTFFENTDPKRELLSNSPWDQMKQGRDRIQFRENHVVEPWNTTLKGAKIKS